MQNRLEFVTNWFGHGFSAAFPVIGISAKQAQALVKTK